MRLQKRYTLAAILSGISFIIFYLILNLYLYISLILCTIVYIGGIFYFKDKDIRVYDAAAIARYYFEMSKLNDYKEKIKDDIMKEKLGKIVVLYSKIVKYLESRPRNATKIYNFLDYYLPFTVNLVNKYINIEKKKEKTFVENKLILKMGVYVKEIESECSRLVNLISKAKDKELDFEMKVFEGCMPIEEMALRGRQTLLFGPMKPVGLDDPKTGRWPYAVVQLRQDNLAKSLYNLVGFQTHLKFVEQKKLLELIPGLEKANIVRYGVMHRNTYINSKKLLNKGYQLIKNPNIFFAGQMTGVEGYVESASSGLIAGINMARFLEGKDILDLDATTAIGALANYISYHAEIEQPDTFEPMNVNFGIFNALERKVYKKERKMAYAKRALENLNKILDEAK